MIRRFRSLLCVPLVPLALSLAPPADAAGTLTPTGSPDLAVRIASHHVDVVLRDGFARTEVIQTFHNPNPHALEAHYAFPLPKSAALSEVVVLAGETVLEGEVVARERARSIYEEERDQGNDAALAEKDGYETFEFFVSPVPAQGDVEIRFVYYQTLEVDTGVARYLYPLEEGGTDEAALAFWTMHDAVDGLFSIDVRVESAWPLEAVRVPGAPDAVIETGVDGDDGRARVHLERQGAALDRDFVLYYALKDDLPGRIELVPYRADPSKPGSFMLVVTPGVDLKPLTGGSDTTFVLDVSGSMSSKLKTLARGVAQVLGEMKGGDRFRIVVFNDGASDLTSGFLPATPETVEAAIRMVQGLTAARGTNLHAGLAVALDDIDEDRATSVVLVTDAVANVGPMSAAVFRRLMKAHDVRVFGFLLGNSGNWPLMRAICEASGGFSAGVSNADDIVGQLVLAKSKVTHECLHDVDLKIRGVEIDDVSAELLGKVYRGEQLVIFGRYARGGTATVTLDATLTGEDQRYVTTFDFPEVAVDAPEIERLWALDRIERLERRADEGLLDEDEAREAIADLGVAYQLVTDETSMLVLKDEAFERRGIERRNLERVTEERHRQAVRRTAPPASRRVDENRPAFQRPAPSRRGSGAGALDPIAVLGALLLALAAFTARGRAS
ncbi:MAG: VIT and VWA domain-containing protein [Planctomycetota bacterium JB042]